MGRSGLGNGNYIRMRGQQVEMSGIVMKYCSSDDVLGLKRHGVDVTPVAAGSWL